jgi:hypothetical protein
MLEDDVHQPERRMLILRRSRCEGQNKQHGNYEIPNYQSKPYPVDSFLGSSKEKNLGTPHPSCGNIIRGAF